MPLADGGTISNRLSLGDAFCSRPRAIAPRAPRPKKAGNDSIRLRNKALRPMDLIRVALPRCSIPHGRRLDHARAADVLRKYLALTARWPRDSDAGTLPGRAQPYGFARCVSPLCPARSTDRARESGSSPPAPTA